MSVDLSVWAGPPIAIMSFNRPQMLERVLLSLKIQTVSVLPQRVHLFQDGGLNPFSGATRAKPEDAQSCVAIFHRHFPEGTVHESQHNIGIALNFERAEKFFFETALLHISCG